MTTNATLQLVKQKAQLHADDETRHAQEYVAPQLKFVNIHDLRRTCHRDFVICKDPLTPNHNLRHVVAATGSS